MSLLNPPVDPPHKPHVLTFTLVALVFVAAAVLWFSFRYYPERKAAEKFFNAVVAGDTDKAYVLWQASDNYKMKDFLADWGPNGYCGAVKSYKSMSSRGPEKSTSIEVNVAIRR